MKTLTVGYSIGVKADMQTTYENASVMYTESVTHDVEGLDEKEIEALRSSERAKLEALLDPLVEEFYSKHSKNAS